MTRAEIKKKLRSRFKKWSYLVEHWGWKFDVYYCDSQEDMPQPGEYADAITFMRWEYLEGSIYFNMKKLESKDDDELEYLVIHELSHFLLSPLQTSKNNLEISATMVARTIKGLDAKFND